MKRLLTLAALAGVLGLTPVLAQTASPPADAPAEAGQMPDEVAGDGMRMGKHGGHHGKGHRGSRMMRMIDANNDGVISDDEAAAMAERAFMRLDRDADGNVTEAEFIDPPGRGRRFWSSWFGDEEKAAVQGVRKEKFATLDADKNNSLSKAEFFVEAKSRLAAADADKDGKVTPWEFRAAN